MRKDLYYNWCKWGRKTTDSLPSNPSHTKLRALVHVIEKLIKVKKVICKKSGDSGRPEFREIMKSSLFFCKVPYNWDNTLLVYPAVYFGLIVFL